MPSTCYQAKFFIEYEEKVDDTVVLDEDAIRQKYVDELYKAYKGQSQQPLEMENLNRADTKGANDTEKDEYWQWNYWYVFKNPDAQKEEKFITINEAK